MSTPSASSSNADILPWCKDFSKSAQELCHTVGVPVRMIKVVYSLNPSCQISAINYIHKKGVVLRGIKTRDIVFGPLCGAERGSVLAMACVRLMWQDPPGRLQSCQKNST